jgi:diguanylate cyclase (GGDEF)-like protein
MSSPVDDLSVPIDPAGEIVRLRRFLVLLTPTLLLFSLLEAGAAIAFGRRSDAMSMVLLAVAGMALLVALVQLRLGAVRSALVTVSATILGIVVSAVIVAPHALETVIFGPLLVVALALPHASGRRLSAVAVACWTIAVLAAILAELIPASEAGPSWFASAGRVFGVAVAAALVLHLLVQFSSRLREAVAQHDQATAALDEVRDAITGVNRELRNRVRELERLNREGAILGEMGELFAVSRDPSEVFAVVARSAQSLFDEASGALYVLDQRSDSVELAVEWGTQAPFPTAFAAHDCWALRRGRGYLVEDPDAAYCRHVGEAGGASTLCIPLLAPDGVLGVLHVRIDLAGDAASDAMRQDDAAPPAVLRDRSRLASTLAERVAMTLVNLRLRETLEVQAIRDPLTGLFNRRYMEESLDRELRRAERDGQPVAVIMLDLDYLKRFNDDYGHEAGDMVLRALARQLQGQVRVEDIVCRFGGEEFVVILPHTSLEEAVRRAERMCKAATELRATNPGLPPRPVTVSVGVAAFPAHGVEAGELLRAADQALYRAKGQGRNQVAIVGGVRIQGESAQSPIKSAARRGSGAAAKNKRELASKTR